MGWHVMQVWECQLKPKEREMTLKGIEWALNRILLENYGMRKKGEMKPYREYEEGNGRMIAADGMEDYGK